MRKPANFRLSPDAKKISLPQSSSMRFHWVSRRSLGEIFGQGNPVHEAKTWNQVIRHPKINIDQKHSPTI